MPAGVPPSLELFNPSLFSVAAREPATWASITVCNVWAVAGRCGILEKVKLGILTD